MKSVVSAWLRKQKPSWLAFTASVETALINGKHWIIVPLGPMLSTPRLAVIAKNLSLLFAPKKVLRISPLVGGGGLGCWG